MRDVEETGGAATGCPSGRAGSSPARKASRRPAGGQETPRSGNGPVGGSIILHLRMRHEPQSLKRFLKCFELLTYRSSRVTRSSGDVLLRAAIEMVQDPDFARFGADPAQKDAQEGAAIWITLRSIDGRLKDVSVPFLAMVVPEAVEAGVCGDCVQPLEDGLPRTTHTPHSNTH